MIQVDEAIAKLGSEQQSEWIEVHAGHSGDGCSLIAQWTPEARRAVEVALYDFALSSDDARDALREVTQWSHRLGVWLACRVARESLRCVPADELRPLRAIETTERWVRGEASAEECGTAGVAADDAGDAAYAASDDAADGRAAACASAACAAYASDDDAASLNAADSAVYSAAACATFATSNVVSLAARRAELRRLCSVIAHEIAPALEVISGSSR